MSHVFAAAPEPKTPLGRYRILSSNAGIRVSPLQLGGMSIGQAWSQGLGALTKSDAFKLLDSFVEAGGNFIDTANHYQDGESETWIGEWMAARQNRDQMVVATKYTSDFRHDLPKGFGVNYHGNHKKSMRLSVDASLQKLQVSFIDILYIHWWDHSSSIREIMDSLHILVEQGKVLYLGVSDCPAWIVSACNEYASMAGKTPFAIYQGHWNAILRDFERDILPMARHYGMALAPWGVTGSGKFQTQAEIAARKLRGENLRAFTGPEQTQDEKNISAALEKVAKDLSKNSGKGEEYFNVTAVAIAYIMAQAPRVFPILGGRKVEHLHDNIKALEIRLSEQQIEFLENVKDFDIGFPSNFIGEDPKVMGGRGGSMLAGAAFVDWPAAEKAIGYEGVKTSGDVKARQKGF